MLLLRFKFNCHNVSYSSVPDLIIENRGVYPISDSKYGDVAYFNGNAHINISPIIYGSSPRTISCWVKRLNRDSGVIHSNGFDLGRYSMFFGLGDKDLVLNYGIDSLNITGNFPNLNWFNIVSTYDGITLRLYVDGVLYGSRIININTSHEKFIIGNDPRIGFDFAFNGYMLDFRVYDEALSSKFISDIYRDGPNPWNIVMYSNGALIEWNCIHNYHIIIKNEHGKILRKFNVKGTYTNIYDLNDNEAYKFEIYDSHDKTKTIYERYVKTSTIDDNEVKNLIKFVSKDFTKIKNNKVSKISKLLINNLNTNDTIKARVTFQNRVQKEKVTFVQNSESVNVSNSSIILMPFLLGGNSEQNVEFKMDDLSTENVSYDELDNTVNVNSKKYSIGDKFILGGKTVRISELN